MKLNLTFGFLLLFLKIGFTQAPCLPVFGGIPAGDNPSGCVMCQLTYSGTTEGYQPEIIDFDFPCGKKDAGQWISFTADENAEIELTLSSLTCSENEGVEVVVYDNNLQPVSPCIQSIGSNQSKKELLKNFIPGENYMLFIDGINGDFCRFNISVSDLIGNIPPEHTGIIRMDSSGTVTCPKTTAFFSIDRIKEANYYKWEVPEWTEIIRGGSIKDTFVNVRFLTTQPGNIKVSPSNACFTGNSRSFFATVASAGIPLLTEVIIVCSADLPMVYKGIQIDSLGVYNRLITNPVTECAENIFLFVQEISPIPQEVVDTVICPGSCVTFNDSCYYTSPGTTIHLPCKDVWQLNISFADTGYFEITPGIDSFVNSLTFNWELTGADSFSIFINGIFRETQSYSSFLFPLDSISGDSIHFKVVPFSFLGCSLKESEITFSPDDLSSTNYFKDSPTVKISPNPSDGSFKIATRNEMKEASVFDISGNLILRSSDKLIELSNQAPGIYFLKIKTEEKTFVRKIMKF